MQYGTLHLLRSKLKKKNNNQQPRYLRTLQHNLSDDNATHLNITLLATIRYKPYIYFFVLVKK